MPKKNLLISAALTAFMLVVATSIASAYERVNATLNVIKTEAAEAEREQDSSVQQEEPVVAPTATEEIQVPLTHQEAALVAANFLEKTDLYSVENDDWEHTSAYKVVFSSGEVVYVSMYGDILAVEEPEVVIITDDSTTNTGSNSSRGSGDSYDDDEYDDDDEEHEEEHEEEDEHDDD